jgi:hypothetical protein
MITAYGRFACILPMLAAPFLLAQSNDSDRDGLADAFEQAILVKFQPVFHVSRGDCETAPAEFMAGSREPTVKMKNGTIYGQVFPVAHRGAASIEIHYYHLWSRDCGRPGHVLDAEGVSGLLTSETGELKPDSWEAAFWYAAAHEGTLCDAGNGGTAARLRATDRGPDVWISRDKHASFLSKELCARGCGKDLCDPGDPLRAPAIINIGEPGVPMNGAQWARSPAWQLTSKMMPDFSDSLITRMPVNEDASYVPSRQVARGVKTTIKVAGNTYESLALAERHAGNALSSGTEGSGAAIDATGVAARHVRTSVSSAFDSVRKSIKRSLRLAGDHP